MLLKKENIYFLRKMLSFCFESYFCPRYLHARKDWQDHCLHTACFHAKQPLQIIDECFDPLLLRLKPGGDLFPVPGKRISEQRMSTKGCDPFPGSHPFAEAPDVGECVERKVCRRLSCGKHQVIKKCSEQYRWQSDLHT